MSSLATSHNILPNCYLISLHVLIMKYASLKKNNVICLSLQLPGWLRWLNRHELHDYWLDGSVFRVLHTMHTGDRGLMRCDSRCGVDSTVYGFGNIHLSLVSSSAYTGIIFCMCAANERRRYIVTSSLTGWAHVQDDHCLYILNGLNEYRCLVYIVS